MNPVHYSPYRVSGWPAANPLSSSQTHSAEAENARREKFLNQIQQLTSERNFRTAIQLIERNSSEPEQFEAFKIIVEAAAELKEEGLTPELAQFLANAYYKQGLKEWGLGNSYDIGKSGANSNLSFEHYNRAEFFYKEASNLGHIEATYDLGSHYCSSRSAKSPSRDAGKNFSQMAAALFQQNADKGHPPSQFELAFLYDRHPDQLGTSSDVNPREVAKTWYNTAIENGKKEIDELEAEKKKSSDPKLTEKLKTRIEKMENVVKGSEIALHNLS